MMRKYVIAAAACLAMAAPAAAAEKAEINYPEGSLGFAALVDGDYDQAVAKIQQAEGVSESDPARLLNLGYAYERLGQPGKARELYDQAMRSPANIDLIVASGDVMSSRELARRAMRRVEGSPISMR